MWQFKIPPHGTDEHLDDWWRDMQPEDEGLDEFD
jgi:hypothetical protein